jgi:hypothetical protein
MRTDIPFDEITEPDSECDIFIARIGDQFPILGERSGEYLKWRYFENPFISSICLLIGRTQIIPYQGILLLLKKIIMSPFLIFWLTKKKFLKQFSQHF